MSRLLKITDLGSGIMVQGTDNVLYPDNATLTYPYNSIIVVTDESDIATFRSASNNDVLFSGLIGKIEIGGEIVTKENINVKFDEIANQESGSGGDVTGLFADASYDSQTKHINFYDKDNTLVAYVDATDFIKDGMVSNVEILNGNLVITFNTDSGKQPITIPLTDIFNPANYYDKTTADSTFATQVVVNEEIAARIAGDGALNTALQAKADKTDTYTKTETDNAIATAMEDIDLSDYVDVTTFNKKELATAKALTQLNDTKADKTELPDVSTLATKTELNAKANSADLATVATSGSYNDLSDKPVIPEGAVVDAALSDTSENPVQNKVVKGALNEKQDALVFYSESPYDEEEGTEATAMIQVIGQGDSSGNSAEINVQPYTVALSASSEGEDPTSTTLVVTSDDVFINEERVLTKSDGVYYVDFAAFSTQGITDADWDGLVAAINAHRPIYAGLGNRYYTAECLYQDGNNIIRMTASDELNHYFYLFTKRGTNDYTMTYEVRPYVTEVEKHNWSAKQDALVSGTNIKTVNNQSIIGSGNIDIQFTQTQADWNETDTTSSAFIKNKPDLSGKANASDVYTKTEIDAMIGNINTILASI